MRNRHAILLICAMSAVTIGTTALAAQQSTIRVKLEYAALADGAVLQRVTDYQSSKEMLAFLGASH